MPPLEVPKAWTRAEPVGFPFIQGPRLSHAVSLPSLCWWQMQDGSCVSHIAFQSTRRRDSGGTDAECHMAMTQRWCPVISTSLQTSPVATPDSKASGPLAWGLCSLDLPFLWISHWLQGYRLPPLIAQLVENLPAMQETGVLFLGREDPLEKEMATPSSILAWRIPWTEQPGRLQSMGSQELDMTYRLNHHHHTEHGIIKYI